MLPFPGQSEQQFLGYRFISLLHAVVELHLGACWPPTWPPSRWENAFAVVGTPTCSCSRSGVLGAGNGRCKCVLLCCHASAHAPLPQVPVSGGMEAGAAAGVLRRYVAVVPLTAGQLLWRVGDAANDFFVIEKGVVRVSAWGQPLLVLLCCGAGGL